MLALANASGTTTGTLVLLPGDRVLTFQPQATLRSDTVYTITVSTAIRDLNGRALAAPFVSHFSTVDTTPPLPPAAGALAATIPDATGHSTVTGSQGTAEPEWTVSIRNLTTKALTSVLPESDGSFSVRVPAARSDKLELLLFDKAGNKTTIPLPRFRNPDGSTVVGAEGGTVEGAAGVAVTAEAGALPDGTVVKVDPITDTNDFPVPLPPTAETNLNFIGGFHLSLGGVTPNQALDVSIPAPSDATVTDTVMVVRSIELTHPITLPNGSQITEFWTLADRAQLEPSTWTYQTASPPFPGSAYEGSYAFLRSTYIINPGLDRILQTRPLEEGNDKVLEGQRYDAFGPIDIIGSGSDGILQSRPNVTTDDERQLDCMNYININYSIGVGGELFATLMTGLPLVFPLLSYGDVTIAATCNQPVRIQAFAPDTGSVLAEITQVASPRSNEILYPENGLTDDHEAPYAVEGYLPVDFRSSRQEVMVTFSERMHPDSILQHFKVFDSAQSPVAGEIEILDQNHTVLFRPHVPLRLGRATRSSLRIRPISAAMRWRTGWSPLSGRRRARWARPAACRRSTRH